MIHNQLANRLGRRTAKGVLVLALTTLAACSSGKPQPSATPVAATATPAPPSSTPALSATPSNAPSATSPPTIPASPSPQPPTLTPTSPPPPPAPTCAWELMPPPEAIPASVYPWINDWLQDDAGRLWVATSAGVFVVEQPDAALPGSDWLQASHLGTSAFGGENVLSLALGPDGRVWAGTLSSGEPYYFDGAGWQALSGEPGQPQERFLGALTFGPDGSLWLGYGVADGRASQTVIARRAPDGTWTSYSPAQVLAPDKNYGFVETMAFDSQGRLWLAGEGVSTFDGQEWTWFPLGMWIQDLCVTVPDQGESRVWIADLVGVRVYRDGDWLPLAAPDGLPNPSALSLASDGAGRVWAGYQGAVARYSPDGELEQVFAPADGLPPDPVSNSDSFSAILVDSSETVWVANRYAMNVARCAPAGSMALEPLPALIPQPTPAPTPLPDEQEIVEALLGAASGEHWAAYVTFGSFTAPGADERLAMVGGIGENDDVRWAVIGQGESGWELRGVSEWFASGFSGPPPSFLPPELLDFDGDGQQEVLSRYFNMRMGWMTGSDTLYRWDGQSLARVWGQLVVDDTRMADDWLSPYRQDLQVAWQWTDLDGDGLDEITLDESLTLYRANESGYVPEGEPPMGQENAQRAFRWDGEAFRPYAPGGPTGPLAYSSERDLWLWQNQTAQPLGLDNVQAFAWSPDGSQLAWWADLPDSAVGLGVYRPETGAQRTFQLDVKPQELGWAPDGRLAYCTDAGRCALVDPQTGEQARSPIPTLGSWSPDGRQVVYAWGRSLHLYDLTSDQEKLLVASFEAAGTALPAWSPRGDWVACKMSNGSYTWLGVLNPDLTESFPARGLTQSFNGRESSEVEFAWSPDGSRLAALVTDPRFEQFPTVLYLAEAPPAGADPVGQPAWQEVLRLDTVTQTVRLAWSPDGEQVVAAIGSQIWQVDLAGEAQLRHQFAFPSPEWGALGWAADGSGYLAWLQEPYGREYLYWFPAGEGEPVSLFAGYLGDVGWSGGRD